MKRSISIAILTVAVAITIGAMGTHHQNSMVSAQQKSETTEVRSTTSALRLERALSVRDARDDVARKTRAEPPFPIPLIAVWQSENGGVCS